MSKKCARCKQLKPLDAFAFNKNARDKKQSYCQHCMTESRQIRYANKLPPSLEKDQLNKYKKKWLMIPSNREASKMRIRNSLIVSRLSTNPDSVKDDTVINSFGVKKTVFMDHLQSLFEKGMSWKNYGAWHLDHIVGLIKFKRSVAVKFCPFVFFAPFVVCVSLFADVFVEMFLTKFVGVLR